MGHRDMQQIGKDAIGALSRLYHHWRGREYRKVIVELERNLPHWRETIQKMPQTEQDICQSSLSWDRAIRVLVAAGILKEEEEEAT